MLTSRLFFVAPLFLAVAAQAAPVTFTSQVYTDQASVTLDSSTIGPVTQTSLPSTAVVEYQDNLDLLDFPSPVVNIENKSVAPFVPNDPVTPAVSYFATVQVVAVGIGLPQSAFGSASLDLDFTVHGDQLMLYTFALTDFTATPFFNVTGSFSLTRVGGGFTPIVGSIGDFAIDQQLLFPDGDYQMSINVRSDLLVAPPDEMGLASLAGFAFGIQAVVPEPATLALFAAGTLLIIRNRRHHA